MGEQREKRIEQIGGGLLLVVLGVGIAELLGFVDVFTLSEFLILFIGLGLSMTVLRWWAS